MPKTISFSFFLSFFPSFFLPLFSSFLEGGRKRGTDIFWGGNEEYFTSFFASPLEHKLKRKKEKERKGEKKRKRERKRKRGT